MKNKLAVISIVIITICCSCNTSNAKKTFLKGKDSSNKNNISTSANSFLAIEGNAACDGNKFDGIDRKAAKTSIVNSEVTEYNTLQELLDYLGTSKLKDEVIGSKISETGEKSNRVDEEKKNVTIKKTWLYTFKRQSDEDYHLILGTTNNVNTANFFNVEISGLPESSSPYYNDLKKAREQFFKFFKFDENKCPAKSYSKEYMNNPIEVIITGSLFFDKLHYSSKGEIGPSWARGNTYWEIHPITSIEFPN